GDDDNPVPTTVGYDKLTGNKTSKNNLVVANAQDAVISATGTLTSVAINSGSSQGPADDLRIKPDITGNGTTVFSTLETSDTAYGNLSGTSMASPNVAGTLLLLQQHYKNLNNRFMKAATLKALACHTADDAGRPGPDAIFGWGLLNAKKAAETISSNSLSSLVNEEKLTNGQTYTLNVTASGTAPLQATIAWTDVPGIANNGTLNSTSRALVNDLDIRITKGATTYFPWKLLSDATQNAIKTQDNNVDNVESILIPGAVAGTYTITVTHKGTLQGGSQNFSLIATGVSSNFAINTLSEDKTVCNNQTASYQFSHNSVGAGTTAFSVVGLPSGAVANLSAASLSASGTVTVTVANLQNAVPGDYQIGLQGVRGSETEIKYVGLKIYNTVFGNVSLVYPQNEANSLATTVALDWDAVANAESYRVQVAADATFLNIVADQVTAQTNLTVSNLAEGTKFYWRVLPANRCGEAAAASSKVFYTGLMTCNIGFNATDFSLATINTTASSQGIVPITVPEGITIGNLTASINISHTYIQDLTVYIEGPESLGNPMIRLFQEPCGDNDNILATISDAGTNFTCNASAPGISGTVKPVDAFSTYNNMPAAGTWTLYAYDPYEGDGGAINGFSLNFCNVTAASLSAGNLELPALKVYPNPSKGIINISLPETSGTTILSLTDIQGRRILTKETREANETLNIGGFSDGVYLLTIQNGNSKISKKIVLNK
ncbi:MAG TPA: S8/S53 family peptidase, partial [Flavobacterium sp.]|nr:S8/S53 family peptidase [Flavobacterium sp.]